MKHTLSFYQQKATQKSIYASLAMSAILANMLIAKEDNNTHHFSKNSLQTQRANVEIRYAKNTASNTNTTTATQQDSKKTQESKSQDLLYGRGQAFVGAEVALVYNRNYWGQYNFNAGVVGGYQYYFKEEWQFSSFRHGIRGYGNVSYATWDWTWSMITRPEINFPALFVRVGADWTIEFNPKSKYVWGFFAGISFDYMLVLQKPRVWLDSNYFGVGNGIGASLNMLNHHKFELLSFYSYNGIGVNFSLRYLFMF